MADGAGRPVSARGLYAEIMKGCGLVYDAGQGRLRLGVLPGPPYGLVDHYSTSRPGVDVAVSARADGRLVYACRATDHADATAEVFWAEDAKAYCKQIGGDLSQSPREEVVEIPDLGAGHEGLTVKKQQ